VKKNEPDHEFEGDEPPTFTHGSSRGDEVVERILRRGERAEALGALRPTVTATPMATSLSAKIVLHSSEYRVFPLNFKTSPMLNIVSSA
jgi:hypothetical protein